MHFHYVLVNDSTTCFKENKHTRRINLKRPMLYFPFNPLMYSAFAIELSDLSKPFKFARLKGFERLENCLTKGTYERF